ncbi:MAG: HEAT repeat domain-containing protein [Pirellulales bacterium]|nr:HEAT repeat domain-containing protein [Pirellulales bacterium]
MRRWIASFCLVLACLGCGQKIGGKSRAQWEAQLADADPGARCEAVQSLGALGSSSVPLIAKAVDDADASVRQAAAQSLGHLAVRSPEAIEPLAKLIEDADARVREAAVRALGLLGPEAKGALPALEKALAAAKTRRDPREPALIQQAIGAINGQGRMSDGA